MITNPPPNDSAPTLIATHATAASPPVAAPAGTASGPSQARAPAADGGRRRSSSIRPQPASTATTNPPARFAARPPATRYAIQRHRPGVLPARCQLAGARLAAALTATAGTAAPAPSA